MYESYTDGAAYCRVLAILQSNQSYSYRVHDPTCIHYQGDDAIGTWRVLTPIAISKSRRISSMLGIFDHVEEHSTVSSTSFLTHKPKNSVWDYTRDIRRYGAFMTPIDAFSVRGEDVSSREKDVTHTRFIGTIRDQYSDYIPKYYPFNDGQFLRYSHYDIPNTHGFLATGTNAKGFLTFDNWNGGRDDSECQVSGGYEIYSMFKAYGFYWNNFPVPIPIYTNQGGWSYFVDEYVDSSFIEDNRIALRSDYTAILEDNYYGLSASFKVHLSFDVSFVDVYANNLAFQNNRIRGDSVVITNYSTVEALTPTLQSGTPIGPAECDTPINWFVRLADSAYSDDIPPRCVYPFTNIVQDNGSGNTARFLEFRRSGTQDDHFLEKVQQSTFDWLGGDIRPASFLASADAMDNQLLIIKTNLLQVFQHLKDVLELVPDISGLGEILTRAMRGDANALVELLDWLTNAILKFKFEQKPTADAAVEILISNALNGLKRLTRTTDFTGYGSFSYELSSQERPNHDGRWVLDVRSKVRCHIDLTTLMVAYLVSNSLGLAPTLERLWQIVPFSFIVDWFFNISKRLHAVQNDLNYMIVRTNYGLYSYRLTYYPSDLQLAIWGLESPDSEKPFGVSVYVRELSYITPRLRESRLDFLRNKGVPNLLTVGSLFIQKFIV